MDEHTADILWAGDAGSKRIIMDALHTNVREVGSGRCELMLPGACQFWILVPTSKLHEAINAILGAGGRVSGVLFKNAH